MTTSLTTSLVRWLYPPLMLIGFNGVAIALIASGASPSAPGPAPPPCDRCSRFVVERLILYEAEWNEFHEDAGRAWRTRS